MYSRKSVYIQLHSSMSNTTTNKDQYNVVDDDNPTSMPLIITKEDMKIYKGKYFLPWYCPSHQSDYTYTPKGPPKKVIVLDLDETIGSFPDLYIVWSGLRHGYKDPKAFYHLCELYPEFFRYGIITILEYLYARKLQKECHNIFIYTNNQCPGKWVSLIAHYLDQKVRSSYRKTPKVPLFDKIIGAFKINNRPFETSRTSHLKKMDDFLRCSLVSENAEICFVDDVHFPAMKSAKVYYINPRPYYHDLRTSTIIQRICQATWVPEGILRSEPFWKDWFSIQLYKLGRKKTYKKPRSEVILDLQISKKMIYHLKEFLQWGGT